MDDKVTIQDIAEASEVSIATVSLVLNHRPGVSAQTRERVMAASKELGYRFKPSFSTQRFRRLNCLGLVIKTDGLCPPKENPFYSRLILGVEEACRRSGIRLVLSMLPVDNDNRPMKRTSLLQQEDIDGLLMVGVLIDRVGGLANAASAPAVIESAAGKADAEVVEGAEEKNAPDGETPVREMPVVLVDSYAVGDPFDQVESDNYPAAYAAVEYLLKKGHREIAVAGGSDSAFPSLRERRRAYFQALQDAGIAATYSVDFNINEYNRRPACEAVMDLLRQNPQVTAIFGVNDDAALVALRAARNLGKRVPEDLSIIGYDDTILAGHALPGLTTMQVDTMTMGRAAVQMLANRLEHPEISRMSLIIHPHLVERDSVASRK